MVIGDVEGEIPTQITSEMKCREQQCLGIIGHLAAAPREQTRVFRKLDREFGSRRADRCGVECGSNMEVEISSSRLVDDEGTWSIQLCVHLGSYWCPILLACAAHNSVCVRGYLAMLAAADGYLNYSCRHSVRTFAFTLIRVHRRTEERSIRVQVWGFRFRCDIKVQVRMPAEIWQLVGLSHRGNITRR